MIYTYDGTYEGLLAGLYRAITTAQWPESVVIEGTADRDFFRREQEIVTDAEDANKCARLLRQRLGQESCELMYLVFHAGVDRKDDVIFLYVKLGMEAGRNLGRYMSHQTVMRAHELSRKVGCEIHRMRGLVRFRELEDGIYYARIYPDHDIVGFMGSYFSRRLRDRRWVIHDRKRNKAVVYDLRRWYISDIRQNQPLRFSLQEKQSGSLWKRYFEDIAIKERRNPRLQRQWMPKRYWRNLVELDPLNRDE